MTTRARGFTLIEVVIAVMILALMMSFVIELLFDNVRERDTLTEALEGLKVENSILDEITRDLRFCYFRAGQFPGDAGFWGRSRQVAGREGDRIDFITCRTSRLAELEEATQAQGNSPLVEVGYACRPSDVRSEWIELWRREDYFADDDPTDGGRFDLVYDKLRKFDIRYYLPTEERAEGDNGLEEWDTKIQHKLPYALVLTVEFDVREPIQPDEAQGKVRRIILLTGSRSIPPDTGMGMDSGMTAMR